MKKIIVYVSYHHKNTEKVAKIFAATLKASMKRPEQVDPNDIPGYDLVGFGSGIYFFRHHRRLLKFARSLPQVSNKKAFMFSTSGAKKVSVIRRHAPLKKILESKGFEIVGEFNCPGFDSFGLSKLIGGLNKGRPNGDDLKNAQAFAEKLKAKTI